MTYVSLGLRILLTLAFIGAGGAKIAGVEMMVATFDQIGFSQGFRYVTGVVEVIGAALLWLPRRQVIGAAVLGGTMVGAVLTHLLILGPSAFPAIILGLLCTAVLVIHRAQIPEVLGRTNTDQA
jgi:uncharacterized membrane protein YphA (DoxX/SURF4 family)